MELHCFAFVFKGDSSLASVVGECRALVNVPDDELEARVKGYKALLR